MARRQLMITFALYSLLAATVLGAEGNPPAAADKSAPQEKIGEVFGKPVYRDQIRAGEGHRLENEVHRLFLRPVRERYFEKHRKELEPTAEEIDKTAAHFRKQFEDRVRNRPEVAITDTDDKIRELHRIQQQLDSGNLSPQQRRELEKKGEELDRDITRYVRFFADFMLRSWKYRVHLYENYGGGRLLFQQAGVEAFDAMRKWIEQHEQNGDFRIDDPALRAKLYEYWTKQEGSPHLIKPDSPGYKLALLPPWKMPANTDAQGETKAPPRHKPVPEKPPAAPAGNRDADVKPIDRLDKDGFSKLHRAALRDDVEEVQSLLQAGADPDVRQRNFRGTPLQYAAAQGHLKVVRLLLKNRATVDATDTNHRTPLIWAAMNGRTDVAKALLDAGAEIAAANAGGWTPLHYAVSKGHRDTTLLLIDRGAPLDAQNKLGQTPLEVAPPAEKQPAD